MKLKAQIALILFLTVCDVFLTVFGYRIGILEEANPLMVGLVHGTPELTGILIVIAVVLLCWLIYRVRDKVRWASTALYFVIGYKLLVLLYEIVGYTASL